MGPALNPPPSPAQAGTSGIRLINPERLPGGVDRAERRSYA